MVIKIVVLFILVLIGLAAAKYLFRSPDLTGIDPEFLNCRLDCLPEEFWKKL